MGTLLLKVGVPREYAISGSINPTKQTTYTSKSGDSNFIANDLEGEHASMDSRCKRLPNGRYRMSSSLNVYIHDLSELGRLNFRLRKSQFSTEWLVPDRLAMRNVVVSDPKAADMFVVPLLPMGAVYFYKKYAGAQLYRSGEIPTPLRAVWNASLSLFPQCKSSLASQQNREVNLSYGNATVVSPAWCQRAVHQAAVLAKTVDIIQSQGPWWKRAAGADHVFTFPGGDGQSLFYNWRSLISSSTHLVVDAWNGRPCHYFGKHVTSVYTPGKDIIIPGGGDHPALAPMSNDAWKVKLSKVKNRNTLHLLAYCGDFVNSEERRALSTMRGLQRVRLQDRCSHDEYASCMREATFCAAPMGKTPWTSRFYMSVTNGCIPVLFNHDLFQLPFSSTVDWTSFIVRFSVHQVWTGTAYSELAQLENNGTVVSMQKQLQTAWRFINWLPSDKLHAHPIDGLLLDLENRFCHISQDAQHKQPNVSLTC